MGPDNLWVIVILLVVLGAVLYRGLGYRRRVREVSEALEDILTGNPNRRIHVGAREAIAPLVFSINRLVDSYQRDKVRMVRAEQAKGKMLASLSHDVRTPLTSALGYLDALCSGVAAEETDEYLQIARDKAYALREYIDQLFTIAQIDADELSLVSKPVDLYELLRSEVIGWIPELEKSKVAVDIRIPDAECFVDGDQHGLARVFANLMQNAVRYGGSGHFIGISAWTDELGAHFEVWDQGPGLSEEELARAFDRLYKADSSRSAKGHGLGLSIAKELVEKMRGTIQMTSTPHVKTSVQVTLPKSKKK